MRRVLLLSALLSGVVTASPLTAQAPASAALWRVAASSIALPPPLNDGVVGTFWNPAAPGEGVGLAVGAHVVHTSEVLGLSGVLIGGQLPLPGPIRAGVLLGRVDIRDLVRTTTSPDAIGGPVPVYSQFIGGNIALLTGPVAAGVALQLHEARFDSDKSSGLTLDAGVRIRPTARFVIAASTHLLPVNLSGSSATDYFLGAEYAVWERRPQDGLTARAAARYGIAYHPDGGIEHVMGLGAELADRLVLDAGVASEAGITERVWRPSVSLGLRFGAYTIALAHGLGTNDVGGTYRVGIDVEFRE